MTEKIGKKAEKLQFVFVTAFRERDGVCVHMMLEMLPSDIWKLGVSLRQSKIVAFFTQKGKVTYLRKPFVVPIRNKSHLRKQGD